MTQNEETSTIEESLSTRKRGTHFAATHPSHFRPKKVQITLRVDSDVIAWFRENHPRYQTLMNAVLRKEMLHAMEEEQRDKLLQG